jgi:FkbM family methyltransferase
MKSLCSFPSPDVLLPVVEREVMWQLWHMRDIIDKHNKFAIFCAGNYARRFYLRFVRDYGLDIDFFIDNNQLLDGQTICGKPVLYQPWANNPGFAETYCVIVSSSFANYRQIALQLDTLGIVSVYSDTFEAARLWERATDIVRRLDDPLSMSVYLAGMWYFLTGDDRFITHSPDTYFAVEEFAYPLGEIIVDAGAFVGDTLESYVLRSLGHCTVYAFEPNTVIFGKLSNRISRLKNEWALVGDIIAENVGCGADNASVSFISKGEQSFVGGESGFTEQIRIIKLDDYFKDKQHPDVLKADIEGSEMDMIDGAKNIISQYKPKIAFSIYHDGAASFVCIPERLLQLRPDYHLAVRTHYKAYEDTVLYAY